MPRAPCLEHFVLAVEVAALAVAVLNELIAVVINEGGQVQLPLRRLQQLVHRVQRDFLHHACGQGARAGTGMCVK